MDIQSNDAHAPSVFVRSKWELAGYTTQQSPAAEPIGNIPPAEAEERYYAMLNEPAMAA
jgi:hypothetical protein